MTQREDSYFVRIKQRYGANIYKTLFIAISLILLVLMPVLSFDAGLTDDERVHEEHGVRLMNYYTSSDTTAAISPMNAQGEWRYKYEPENYPVIMNIYGGFFDMVCAFVYKYVTSGWMGEYESKHFMIALTGEALFILTGLIALQLSGSWAAALLGLLFAALSPRLFGHSLDNPKDIPFAASFAFGLYQILLLLRDRLKLSWKRAILLILSLIVTIDIRIGGFMLIFYMLLFSGIFILYDVFIARSGIKQYIAPFLMIIGIAVCGYLGASLFWPWALKNPVMNPFTSFRVFSQFSQFNSYELFEGVRINNDAIPWYFIPKWYYITFPIYLVAGLILFSMSFLDKVRPSIEKLISILLIVTAATLPLVLVMVQKSNLFDDGRHLYFVLPSFLALAAVGWYWIFKKTEDTYIWPVVTICALTMAEPLLFIARNHPHEVMYFSPLIGGDKGAFKNYEMDYWGFSLRAGVEWLDKTDSVQVKGRKTRVRLWYGEQLKVKYYTDKSKHLEYVLAGTASPDWDYWLVLPAESKNDPNLLANWPPPNTIHQIMVDDIPLCAIVRNPLSDVSGKPADPIDAVPAGDLMGKGMAYYNKKDYNNAILQFKAILQADSDNMLAYNNLVASYNMLEMYNDATEAGARGIRLFPDFTLLKNNLAFAGAQQKKLSKDERYYIGLSYNYFAQMEFKKCIYTSEQLLKLNPKSVTAYNNICASQNSLGNFKAAEIACQKGLEIAPGAQLLKNNLQVSEKGLSGQIN